MVIWFKYTYRNRVLLYGYLYSCRPEQLLIASVHYHVTYDGVQKCRTLFTLKSCMCQIHKSLLPSVLQFKYLHDVHL